jgi:hypothetical protein
VAASGNTANACGGWAGCGRFEVLRRVSTGGDGLLQLCNRRRGLRGGFCQVGGGVWCIGTPLRVTAQINAAAIREFKRHGTFRASQRLFPGKQPIPFDEYTTNPFRGNCDYLANNAFDDGNNTAHVGTLRVYRQWVSIMPTGFYMPLRNVEYLSVQLGSTMLDVYLTSSY